MRTMPSSESSWAVSRTEYHGEAAALLKQLEILFETKIVSAHRTPQLLYSYAETAEHVASKSSLPAREARPPSRHDRRDDTLPVLGVPVQLKH